MSRPRTAPRMKGGLDLGGTKIQAVVTDGESAVLGSARRETPQRRPRGGHARARRGDARRARRRRGGADGTRRASASARRARSTPRRARSCRCRTSTAGTTPYPLGPALADELGRAGVDRQRRQRRGRGRAPLRRGPGLRLVPRRVLGDGRGRRHRHRRPASRRARVGRRDRPRLLEARRPPLQLRARRVRRGVRRARRARGPRARAREGAARRSSSS